MRIVLILAVLVVLIVLVTLVVWGVAKAKVAADRREAYWTPKFRTLDDGATGYWDIALETKSGKQIEIKELSGSPLILAHEHDLYGQWSDGYSYALEKANELNTFSTIAKS